MKHLPRALLSAALAVGTAASLVLSPLAAILIKEAHDCGIVRLWRD